MVDGYSNARVAARSNSAAQILKSVKRHSELNLCQPDSFSRDERYTAVVSAVYAVLITTRWSCLFDDVKTERSVLTLLFFKLWLVDETSVMCEKKK